MEVLLRCCFQGCQRAQSPTWAHRDLLVSKEFWGILKWIDSLLKEKEQAMACVVVAWLT
jgi:hypothetical protein